MEQLVRDALTLVLVFSALPLGCSMVAGLIASVLQAATQIQEQTLSFVPKLAVTAAVAFFAGPWFFRELGSLFNEIFTAAAIGRQ